MSRSVEGYLSLAYTIQLTPEDDGSWFVQVVELPGCMSAGDTPDEAVAMIRDAMAGWIEAALEHGDHIPEPRPLEGYSGKFVLRVPTSLHHDLAEAAEREGVSLNQYCNVVLARSVGRPLVARVGASREPATAEALRQRQTTQ